MKVPLKALTEKLKIKSKVYTMTQYQKGLHTLQAFRQNKGV